MPTPYSVPGFSGVKLGRPPCLSPAQVKSIVKAAVRGKTQMELAKLYGVSRATIQKYLALAAGR